jgi:hypothetical protein
MNRNATYQQLRSHLAYLKLAAAAEHLPAALEAAERDKPGYTQFLHDLLDVEVTATGAVSTVACASRTFRRPRRSRSSTSRPNHRSTAGSSTNSPRCASSTRRRICSSSGHPALARRCSRSPWD